MNSDSSNSSGNVPNKANAVSYWQKHPFFAPDTVVLGIDIGIEGIGICIRKGKKILYDKTYLSPLPKARALADRRTLRASRHSRKNRKVRMHRLRALFEKHNLPWLSDDVMNRSDPFVMRHRAVKSGSKLASKEALTVCIRNLVRHRGYDYYAMESKEIDNCGASNKPDTYPWGDSTSLVDVKNWLRNSVINQEVVDIIDKSRDDFIFKGRQVDDETWETFKALVDERQKLSINKVCKEYAKKKQRKDFERRARGMNFPRSGVANHLQEILEKHSDLIENYDDFIDALFRPCLTKEDKGKSIFYYNRKTPDEAKKHYEKKVKKCPFSEWLEVPEDERKCCQKKDPWYRRWNLADFLSGRTFYLSQKVGKKEIAPLSVHRLLPESVVRDIIQLAVPESGKRVKWAEVKKKMTASLAREGWELSKEHEDWNEDQKAALQDLCDPDPTYLKDRANMSSYACEKLFNLVTDNGRSFDPESMEVRKKESGLYEQRQKLTLSGGIFPQVSSLLGTLGKKKKGSGQEEEQKTFGLLHRLFNKELASQLGGKTVPDYVVIECIRDVAKNQEQKKERSDEIEKRRQKKKALKKAYGVEGEAFPRSMYFRIALWEQQGGTPNSPARCPFTGKLFQTLDPLDPNLELAHLYPASREGYYIMDNLVLTTYHTNKAMRDDTPVEAARRGAFGQSVEQMIEVSKSFKWGKTKRELFAWDKKGFPDCFNNLTRVSQLASQLRRHVAFWLGILEDPKALKERIGYPHGELTAAMRRSLLPDDPEFKKDRDTYTHHRVDAALLSCIPPTGMDLTDRNRIFFNKKTEANWQRFALTIKDGMPYPDIAKFLREDKDVPVIKKPASHKYKPLGDRTFWSVDKDGNVRQREPLDPTEYDSIEAVRNGLVDIGIYDEVFPSDRAIDEWLMECTKEFKRDQDSAYPVLFLKNEQGKKIPVKSVCKKSGKKGGKGGLVNSPLGWSGVQNEKGTLTHVRKLNEVYDRIEIWLGRNPKGRWVYQKRVCPTVNAWRGLQRMGLLTKKLDRLPEFVRKVIVKKGVKSLKDFILGKLFPHSILVATLRKDDVVSAVLKYKEKRFGEEVEISKMMWGYVSSIITGTNGGIKISSLERKNMLPRPVKDVDEIASILKLKSAEEEAQARGLKP